ncbi:hypothetical protein HZS_5243 [Henneguya salminicola]|nr:hypothetical protein HZS_5243 [Henneguya salminicola]
MLARHDAIFIEDIYISGGSNNCNIDSDISDMKYSSTKKNRRNKLFILPTGSDEYCSNLEDLEDTDISMPTENEAIREYILPINRVSYQKSKQTLKTVSITIQPDINLPTSYMSPSPFFPFSPSMSSLKSEDGLSSSKNSIEYLKVKEKPEKISLLKLYGKLDQILSEVKDLRLTLPSIVRQEIYHYFDENSGKHTKGPHSSLEHKYSSDVHTCNMSDVEKPATSNKFSINLTKIDKYCVQR